MIGYLRGKVLENESGRLLVEANGGVGYEVIVPFASAMPGETQELFIYTHVREDALDLYGFKSRSEKRLFLTLLSVNGIGPKAAISILSHRELSRLIDAISRGRKADLNEIPGVGKKLAERLVLELSDKLEKQLAAGEYPDYRPESASATTGIAIDRKAGASASARDASQAERDAREALIGLGYRETQVEAALERLAESRKIGQTVESGHLVKQALKHLSAGASS